MPVYVCMYVCVCVCVCVCAPSPPPLLTPPPAKFNHLLPTGIPYIMEEAITGDFALVRVRTLHSAHLCPPPTLFFGETPKAQALTTPLTLFICPLHLLPLLCCAVL